MKRMYLYGAGGHARSLISCLRIQERKVEAIFDDIVMTDEQIMGISVKHSSQMVVDESFQLLLSIGDNQKRKILLEQYKKTIMLESIVHPHSFQDPDTNIGEYNQLLWGSYIGSCVILGKNNIVNTGAKIEHESIVGDHNHIAVGAIMLGRVKIGSLCFIGAGAVIREEISITDNVTIGSNSYVHSNITEPGVYVGNPARKIRD